MNSKILQLLFQTFGAALILLGGFAFIYKNSVASLFAGGISGILILISVIFWKKESSIGAWAASILTLILTFSFTSRAITTGKELPIFLGSISLILCILSVVSNLQKKR